MPLSLTSHVCVYGTSQWGVPSDSASTQTTRDTLCSEAVTSDHGQLSLLFHPAPHQEEAVAGETEQSVRLLLPLFLRGTHPTHLQQ